MFLVLEGVVAQPFQLTGRVNDSAGGSPLAGATVALYYHARLEAQSSSSASGDFQISSSRRDTLTLVVSHQGFITYSRFFASLSPSTNLGDIFLVHNTSSLKQVTVVAQKRNQAFRTDKQLFNASQFAQATNGNGVDVLRNLPGMSSNSFGELSLRGSSNFLLMLNGKPVQGDVLLVLNQLSAAAIEQIEISTIPGAKVDAEGKGGVVNIITKTAVQDGWMLQGNIMYGLPPLRNYDNRRNARRHGADLALGYRRAKWDLSGGFNALRNDIAGNREGDVFTIDQSVRTSFPSFGERSFKRYNYGGRLSVQYNLNNNAHFTAGLYHGYRFQSRVADLRYQVTRTNESSGAVISGSSFFNANDQQRRGKFWLGSLGYETKFDRTKLAISGLFERANLYGNTYNANLAAKGSSDTLQFTTNPYTNPLNAYRLKADLETTLDGFTFQYGYQYRFDVQKGDFLYRTYAPGTGWELSAEFSGNLRTQNHIHAAYAQLNRQWSTVYFSGGLRVEHLNRGLSFNAGETETQLQLTNFFPSALLRINTGEKSVVKFGYTRRIKRNSNFELNPLPEREHSETLEQGDPRLLPEFSGTAEIGLEHSFGSKGSFFVTAYQQQIKNPVQRVNKVYNDTILNRIFTNAGKGSQWGFETNFTYKIAPWWSTTVGGNIYHFALRGSLFNGTVAVNNGNWVYSINANETFSLKKNWMIQLAINYLSQRVTAQGEDSRFLTPHLTVRKTSANKRFSLQAQWLNISAGLFKSNEQRITTYGTNFFTTTNYLYETDQMQVSLGINLSKRNRKFTLPQSEIGEKEF